MLSHVNQNGTSCLDELQTPDFTEIDFDTLVQIAETGDQLAQYRVGLIYCIGDGIEKNLPKAAEWWIRSSKQGNENAQFCLMNFCHFLNVKDHIFPMPKNVKGQGGLDQGCEFGSHFEIRIHNPDLAPSGLPDF